METVSVNSFFQVVWLRKGGEIWNNNLRGWLVNVFRVREDLGFFEGSREKADR